MLVTESWMRINYIRYNNLYWDGKLPNNITFKISRARNTWGFASYSYSRLTSVVTPTSITLSNYYDSPEEVKLTTLLHEMIHIADYTLNPHHFVCCGRRVRNYDAHGWWFKSEANRLKVDGWDIEKYVTAEEQAVSTLTSQSARLVEIQKENSLLVVVRGSRSSWMFKTNTWHINEALNTVSRSIWGPYVGEVTDIDVYTFNNEKLAMHRSCGKRLRGWNLSSREILTKLEGYKATEIHDYSKTTAAIVRKLNPSGYSVAA